MENIDISSALFRRKFRNCMLFFQGTNLRKNVFFWKTKIFQSIFLEIEQKAFELLAKLFVRVLKKLRSTCPVEISQGKCCFLGEKQVHWIYDIERRFCGTCLEMFSSRISKTVSYIPEKSIRVKVFFQCFRHLWDIGRNIFQLFVWKFSTGLSQLRSTCRCEQFGESFFLKTLCFLIFFGRWEKTITFSQKCLVRRWVKKITAEMFVHVEKNALSRSFFIFQNLFKTLSEKAGCRQKKLAMLSKLHNKNAEDHFEGIL